MVMRVVTRVGSKGEIEIPEEFRRKCSLQPGTAVVLELSDDRIIVHTTTPEKIDRLRGFFKGGPSMCDQLLADRHKERD